MRYPTAPPNRVIREGDVGVGFTQQVLDVVWTAGGVGGIRHYRLWKLMQARIPRWRWLHRATCLGRLRGAIDRLVKAGDVTTELLPGDPVRRGYHDLWIYPADPPGTRVIYRSEHPGTIGVTEIE